MATDTISPLVSLAGLLGGTKTTSSAGDTSALQAVLGQLQQQQAGGYEQLLQQIFSQASGQIPGFTNAFANAQGARSRGNSAIQTALAELLKQTTLEGQKQIVAQQQANTGQQIQAGGAIAQATKGSTGTSGTNLGNAAKNLAILQMLTKLKDTPLVTSGMSAVGNLFGGGATTEPTSAAAPNLFATDAARYDAGVYQAPEQMIDFSQPSVDTQPIQAFDNFVNLPEYQPDTGEIPANYEELWGFADGGLVPRIQRNFADGGLVTQRAAGGRRSAAPSIQTTAPKTTETDNTLPREQLAAPAVPAPTLSDTLGGLSITDIAGGEGNVSFGGGDPAVAGAVRSGYNTLNTINSGLGQLGQSNIEGLGIMSGLINARDPQEAVKNTGIGMLGLLSAPAGAIAQGINNPTLTGVIDAGAMLNPATAMANLIGAPFGYSVGSVVEGIRDLASPNNPVGPNQMAQVAANTAAGNADVAGGFGSADATAGANAGDAMGVGGDSDGPAAAADGGEIPGETTGVDDSQTIKVSGGEFVISADVVDAVGADFFEMLQQALHTPAAVQRKRA